MLSKPLHRVSRRQHMNGLRMPCRLIETRLAEKFYSSVIVEATSAANRLTASTFGKKSQSQVMPQDRHSSACNCRKPGFLSYFSLCRFIPLQQFGNSVLPTPLIIILRLVMPASSLVLSCNQSHRRMAVENGPKNGMLALGARFSSAYLRPRRLSKESRVSTTAHSDGSTTFAHMDWRVSIAAFLAECSRGDEQDYARWKVKSITWVKALASHMSHEFVQFVVQNVETGESRRLIADRQETGDWISIMSNPDGPIEMSDMFTGLEAGTPASQGQRTPYTDRHMLPLPLVSVVFNSVGEAPGLRRMAHLLSEVSSRRKEYNPLREHCWWFSEKVIVEVAREPTAQLKEWPWSRWRYSFVIVNRYVRRHRLEVAARQFEEHCLREFEY